ncbi:hypothetical protein EG328_004020 [Venturia inaequalis]|uniref:Yeast cell wall synthesis Kre9/Knh1-like N-terminal domain-containing protein n=1 Tax=Venturia inaequalis TaxID=5025 RepID=A0A8H3URT3_VENIN|nr:hypothetical protein EG328_004020 [Venturia inaequalis]KAE9989614.1 hypothetical protein EG327_002450 [Venturia inaequalis]RDI79865.1 hypothetical protein Vi05172_g10215 [Venturia inaequalis]
MQFQIVTVLFAAYAAIANAAAPTTQCTDGCNPIALPSLGQNVPVGAPFTITWTPTTKGTVSIQLLKGPSTNVVPLGPQIVSGIANTGTYSWTPSSDLVQSLGSGYGLQLISDIDGTFQYSVQFGISNAAPASSSVAAPSSAPATSAPASSAAPTAPGGDYGYAAPAAPSAPSNATTSFLPSVTISKYVVASTGYPLGNSSDVHPTGSLTVPNSLKPTTKATASTAAAANSSAATSKPLATGAASQLGMSFGGAVIALAGAIFVL